MSRETFEPIGEVARWVSVYELLRKLPTDGILTYEQMGEALSVDPEDDRHLIQMAARRALKELLNVEHRACKNVKNVGYRVAAPDEHLGLAENRNRKAGRQLKAGKDVATKVDLSVLNQEQRGALELIAAGFARQMEINRRVAEKQKQHDEAINLLMRRVEAVEKRVD